MFFLEHIGVIALWFVTYKTDQSLRCGGVVQSCCDTQTFPLQVQTLSAAPTANSTNSAVRQRVRKRTKVLSIARK